LTDHESCLDALHPALVHCTLLALICYHGRSPRVEWSHHFQLALIFYCGRSPRVEWKHCFQLALVFYRGRAHEIENFCTLSQLHVELSSLISLCRFPFGIATSRSTHCQQTIGTATSCSLNVKKLVIDEQSLMPL